MSLCPAQSWYNRHLREADEYWRCAFESLGLSCALWLSWGVSEPALCQPSVTQWGIVSLTGQGQ